MSPSVLIVDDSVTVRMDLKDALEAAGFATALSATLASARDMLARNSFDVLILDVLLPDGDGLDLLRELKSGPSPDKIPVMLLSSEDEVRARVRGLKTGADEYLGKPYDKTQLVARARALVKPQPSSAKAKPVVLLIDDSLTFREALCEMLEPEGYEVYQAGTGEDGLSRMADLRPDAVIVDGLLPGMEGVDVIRSVRADASLRGTPCLLLTASLQREEETRALEAGADLFVCKTEDKEVILARLRVLIRPDRSPLPSMPHSLLGPKRVLAVDDSMTYLGELTEQLRGEGYDVAPARSGEEALELLQVQAVDAILLDVMMPGLSGKEVCRRIKSTPAWRDIPLLMLTALEEREALLEGINAGADDYITKSSRFDVLKARLKAQLRRKQFEEENRRFRDQLLKRELEALELQAIKELSDTRAAHIDVLEKKNEELRVAKESADMLARELEAFSYSVSHDLRAPLRGIDGFSQVLLEEYGEAMDDEGKRLLTRIRTGTRNMGALIEDMLGLAQVSRKPLASENVNLTSLAREIADGLEAAHPGGKTQVDIAEGLACRGDEGLLRILLENLLGNAWKFSAKAEQPRIRFYRDESNPDLPAFVVKDNGAGFDMAYASKLFQAFQRLHSQQEFAGTGVGLATVHRVVQRHGGKIWAEGRVGAGAEFHFVI